MPGVAVLGTGTMGAAMAACLVGAGLDVSVWNRTDGRAASIAGARACRTPAEAVAGVDVAVTMLSDAAAVESVGEAAFADLGATAGPIWLQMSTVGAGDTERLRGLAERLGVTFVDAPVLGSREAAESGSLVVFASGDEDAVAACRPVFEAVGARTLTVGPAGEGTRLKVVVNAWIMGCIAVLADTIALAEASGVSFADFLDATDQGAVGALYTGLLGQAMDERDFEHRFGLALALKDASLALDGAPPSAYRMLSASRDHYAAAVELGFGDEDISRVLEVSHPTTTSGGRF